MLTLTWLDASLLLLMQAAALMLFALWQRRPKRAERKARRREEIVALAIKYGKAIDPNASVEDQQRHALAHAQELDASDNGKRDYSDRELRMHIVAHWSST